MWGVVLAWVAGVPAALALLLLAPVHVRVGARVEERFDGEVEVRWLVVRTRFPLRGDKKPKERRRGFRFHPEEDFFPALRRFLRRMRRAVHVEALDALVRVGAGDPADTGQLVGYAAPLAVLLNLVPAAHVRVEPDWDEPTLRGTLTAAFRAVPLVVLGVTLAFLAAGPVRRTLRAGRREAAA